MDNTDSLDQKLRKVEDDHAVAVVDANLSQHAQSRRDAANRYLGGAMVIDRLKEHLESQVMQALLTVEEHKLYLEFDCQTFAEFLDRKDLSPMSKSTYYRKLELLAAEGSTKFDLLTEWGVPLRIRKQLEAGDITVEGDEVVIGDERVAIGDSPRVIKAIIERLVTEKNTLNVDLDRAASKIEAQKSKISVGEAEVEELRRSIDAMNEGTYYDRAFAHAVNSLLLLQEAIGSMPDAEREQKSQNGIDQLWTQIVKVRTSYGVNYAFAETNGGLASIVKDSNMVEDILRTVAEDDDFGDEAEA